MNKTLAIIVIIILVASGAGFLIYSNSGSSRVSSDTPTQIPTPTVMPTPTNTNTEPPLEPTNTPPSADQQTNTKEITVTGQNYSFSPSTITVKKGDTVKITFKNADGIHDVRIDEFNAATKIITTGQETAIQFTADKVGTFEYYCSVGEHRAMGMKGALVVE